MSTAIFAAKRLLGNVRSEVNRALSGAIRPGGRVVTYHSIDTEVDGDRNRIYNMAYSTFAQSINTLVELSSSQELLKIRAFGRDWDSGVSITFDDGYRSTLTVAARLLVEHHLPFHVFISPRLVQSGDRRYLDASELAELARLPGASIGAHGYDHVALSDVPPQSRVSKLKSARTWLEDVIQQPVLTMSYPFGDTPVGIQRDVAAAGYEVAACSIWGTNMKETNPLMLHRMDIWDGDSRRAVTTKLLGHWQWMSKRTSQ